MKPSALLDKDLLELSALSHSTGVEFLADAWSRRVAARMGDVEVSMLSREDLIANKRATGRTQDIADAEFLERM